MTERLSADHKSRIPPLPLVTWSQCSPPLDRPQLWLCDVCIPLRHTTRHVPNLSTVKPASSLVPLRLGPTACISSTSSKPASQITQSQHAYDGPPLSVTGKPRREVPLPSQEKKEGAMQYALYVSALHDHHLSFMVPPLEPMINPPFPPEQPSIKWPIGPVKAPSGP